MLPIVFALFLQIAFPTLIFWLKINWKSNQNWNPQKLQDCKTEKRFIFYQDKAVIARRYDEAICYLTHKSPFQIFRNRFLKFEES